MIGTFLPGLLPLGAYLVWQLVQVLVPCQFQPLQTLTAAQLLWEPLEPVVVQQELLESDQRTWDQNHRP